MHVHTSASRPPVSSDSSSQDGFRTPFHRHSTPFPVHRSSYEDDDSLYTSRRSSASDESFHGTSRPVETRYHRTLSSYDHDIIVSASAESLLLNPIHANYAHKYSLLKARFDTLNSNYQSLVNAIPQVFSHIPNPYNIPIPVSMSSASTSASASMSFSGRLAPPERKPKNTRIKYWTASDSAKRTAASGAVQADTSGAADSDDDHNEPPSLSDAESVTDTTARSKKKKSSDANVLGFLEYENGVTFKLERIGNVRDTAYTFYNGLLREGTAPLTWGKAFPEVNDRFRQYIATHFPAALLGQDWWKIDAIGTATYPQFKKNNKRAIEAMNRPPEEKKRKRREKGKEREKSGREEMEIGDVGDDERRKRRRKEKSRATGSDAEQSPSLVPENSFPPIDQDLELEQLQSPAPAPPVDVFPLASNSAAPVDEFPLSSNSAASSSSAQAVAQTPVSVESNFANASKPKTVIPPRKDPLAAFKKPKPLPVPLSTTIDTTAPSLPKPPSAAATETMVASSSSSDKPIPPPVVSGSTETIVASSSSSDKPIPPPVLSGSTTTESQVPPTESEEAETNVYGIYLQKTLKRKVFRHEVRQGLAALTPAQREPYDDRERAAKSKRKEVRKTQKLQQNTTQTQPE
ncbi:hypothetical protein GGX14DRAFT_468693 [Mycena pura]|uniref:Uncharacterized protein n=1 Tax=Mycena pura TaxID=153505 RepID=A0AAD6V2N2_9AGAR|nr:hypothetical protein GGX14DRAFT_468693 [Mycena pura]